MTAAIVFATTCGVLAGCLAICGLGRIADRDQPAQGWCDLALAGVVLATATIALREVLQ